MVLYSHRPLSPWAEVIKDVKELFLIGWHVWFDAWLCSKVNKITSSLCNTCAAAVSRTGGWGYDSAVRGVFEGQNSP